MPYIITATNPTEAAADALGPDYTDADEAGVVSRRAVATLDEARDAAAEAAIEAYVPHAGRTMPASSPHLIAAYGLPESGGTVGPLPDGTVIEVERVSGYALIQRIDPAELRPKSRAYPEAERYFAAVIDAYNAAQEAGR